MPTPAIHFLPLVALLFVSTAGCAKQEGEPTVNGSQDGELSGEVFIVTKGAQNFKLGLVTVVVIPEADIQQFIEHKRVTTATLIKEQETALQAEGDAIASSRKAIAEGEAAIPAAKKAAYAASLKYMEVVDWENPEIGKKEQQEQRMHEQEAKDQQERVTARRKELGKQQGNFERLQAARNYLQSSEYYFLDMPAGITSAKTNADGLFMMTIPRQGRFALAAHASRQVMDATEQYYWLVWTSLDGAATKRVMLSNDNLTTAVARESVITLPR
jgi:hypothetical protein